MLPKRDTSGTKTTAREDTQYLKKKKTTKTKSQTKLKLMRLNAFVAIKVDLFQGYPKIIYYSSACAP